MFHTWLPFTAVLFCCAAVTVLLFRRMFGLVLVFLLGLGYSAARTGMHEPGWFGPGAEIRAAGWFVPGEERRGYAVFEVDDAALEETGEDADGLEAERIILPAGESGERHGRQTVLLQCAKDRTRMNPGTPAARKYSWRLLGIGPAESTAADFFRDARDALSRFTAERFDPETAALVAALTTGETGMLDPGTREAFSITGLAHILSISGTHFGLFSVIVFGALVFLINRLPEKALLRLTLIMTPKQAAALLTLPVVLVYLGLSGGSIPAVRSFIMVSLFLAGLLIERKHSGLRALAAAAVLLCIWDPGVLLDLSFQLSFLAAAGIGLAADRETAPAEGCGARLRKAAKESFIVSGAATAATAPLVAYAFHYFPLLTPLSNILVTPLVGFVIVPCSVIASFVWLLTGHYPFASVISLAAEFCLWLVKLLAMVPYADLRIPAFPLFLLFLGYGGLAAYGLTRKRRWILLALAPGLAWTAVAAFQPTGLTVTFVDVGQGDSAIVRLPDGKTLVIDTGRTGSETAGVLRYYGIRRIDALVLSHGHPDHIGGADRILRLFPVSEIWQNGRVSLPVPEGTRVRTLGQADMVEAAGYRISVLHPAEGASSEAEDDDRAENNASLVLRIEGVSHSFLFPGDIMEEEEEGLVFLGDLLASDVLKAPHHGGRSSVHDEFFRLVRPDIAVVSVGRDNTFGHPSAEMLEALEDAAVFRTDRDGAVRIRETADGLECRTWREDLWEPGVEGGAEARNIRRLFSAW
ncbi:MAG: DNA internalization-related competence protein ComEC/Rec2 [Thermodesulfovibrionales bacterium]